MEALGLFMQQPMQVSSMLPSAAVARSWQAGQQCDAGCHRLYEASN